MVSFWICSEANFRMVEKRFLSSEERLVQTFRKKPLTLDRTMDYMYDFNSFLESKGHSHMGEMTIGAGMGK